MLADMTFKEVLAEYPWSDGGCDMETVSEDFCHRHGFARARIYQTHPGPTIRADQNYEAEYEKRRRNEHPTPRISIKLKLNPVIVANEKISAF